MFICASGEDPLPWKEAVVVVPQPVVFASESNAELLRRVLPQRTLFVKNRRELFGAMFTRGAVAFVDFDIMDSIDGGMIDAPIVALMSVPSQDALKTTVSALEKYSWLSHVVQAPLLSMDRGRAHCDALLERLVTIGEESSPVGSDAVGRSALIARASRRVVRFDRMRDFFAAQGLTQRLTETLLDVGEELVMNGLYDAPKEGGFYKRVFSREQDVELPADRAPEISYGVEPSTAFVRLRDPFGSFTRDRLIEVLARCASKDVDIDHSRGGAGLGLWRIFKAASSIAVKVIPGSLTDITVSIGRNDSRRIARPLAVDLYFGNQPYKWAAVGRDEDQFLVDQSITLLRGDHTPTPSPC